MSKLTRDEVIARVASKKTLQGEDLSNLNLSQTDLYLANLNGAYLTDADLTEANLCRANLTRANLTRANLHGATYNRKQLENSMYVDDAILWQCVSATGLMESTFGILRHFSTGKTHGN